MATTSVPASEYESIAVTFKVGLLDLLDDATRVVKQARKTVDNVLNKRRQSDLAVLDKLLGQLEGDRKKVTTSPVTEVPYFGGSITKASEAARSKAYELVDQMRLTGPIELVADTAEKIGKGAGKSVAALLEEILPSLAIIVVLACIVLFVFIRAKRTA